MINLYPLPIVPIATVEHSCPQYVPTTLGYAKLPEFCLNSLNCLPVVPLVYIESYPPFDILHA